MKFFRKPIVAVLLALIIAFASTLLSFEVRFGSKCKEVADGFQDGVYFNGEWQPSCASRLRSIAEYTEKISGIAYANGISTEELSKAIYDMKNGLKYSADDADFIYYCYSDMDKQLSAVKAKLHNAQISQSISSELDSLYAAIADEEEGIKNSGYNESVRDFIREYDKFPVSYFYWHTNVVFPSYFE